MLEDVILLKPRRPFSMHDGIPVENILDLKQILDSHYQQNDTTKRTSIFASAFTRSLSC
jgi:hypothetical protein